MFKSILIAVDLTAEESWKTALPQAIELLHSSQGTLHVMSVVPDAGMPIVEEFFPPNFEQEVLNRARNDLDALIKREVPGDVNVKQHVEFGQVHACILAAIKETGCDLVVMGGHAPDWMREFLVGSNADRVVRRSPVSVLVVRG